MMIFRRFLMIAALFLASAIQLSAQVKDTLYATNRLGNSLSIFDITAPSTPVLVNGINSVNGMFNNPIDLAISRFENVLYVLNNGNAKISVFDLTINGNQDPVLVKVVSTGNNPVSMAVNRPGNALYIACNQSVSNNDIYVFDISNPRNPIFENTLPLGSTSISDITVDPLGKFLYVGTALPTPDNLRIYSLADRLFPALSSSIALTGVTFLNSITLNALGNVVYGTDGSTDNLLPIVNITYPLSPSLITPFLATGTNPVDAALGFSSTRALYVANQGSDNISVFNVTSSASVPTPAPTVSSAGIGPTSIAVHPLQPYFYVANPGSPVISNLAVFNISTPLAPANIPASTTGTQASGPIKLLAYVHLAPLPPTDVRMVMKRNCCPSQKGAATALVWNPSPSLTIVEYRIYKNGSLFTTVPASNQTYIDCGISGHNQYQVSAVDFTGEESALVNALFIQ